MPHSSYKPADFNTAALQHSKVQLTWDEPDARRLKIVKNFSLDNERENDIRDYMASSNDSNSTDEDDDGNTKVVKRDAFKVC